MGPSVAYKTTGTFLSQKTRHKDASGPTTDGRKAVEMQRYAQGRHQAMTTGPVISTYF